MHAVTKKAKEQVDKKLKEAGHDTNNLSPDAQSVLDRKYEDIDNWMAHKPDWIEDNDIVPTMKDGNSSLD